jgi:predicted transcriptional regulator
MKVEDIMTKEVVSVGPETGIAEVAGILFSQRFHGVPVLENNKIVGILTETDFFTKDEANIFLPSYISFLKENKVVDNLPKDKKEKVTRLFNVKAKDIMSTNCTTVRKDMEVEDLISFYKKTKLTTLPVVDENGLLAGIVTVTDIIGLVNPQRT